MVRLLLIVGALVLVGWAGVLFVGGDDAATRARKAEEQKRIEALKPRAEKGEVDAEVALADHYRLGQGVARDTAAAATWYARAANKGDARARYALGALYEAGDGVKQDFFRAAEWYRLAADIGNHADAQFALGELHFHGRGVGQDYSEALKWYLRAARQGHAPAQYVVGAMYQEGWGLKRDYVEAYAWFTLAAAKREQVLAVSDRMDPEAARRTLADKMNRHQIERAEKKAEAWRPGR